ncbi:multiheme c-type cytochrome [Crateriforma conspicua]|uniref:multiheme c-type cytochrome n=1 Tax=Crateriforma conspicua TaxID=2527996 RepID=UPI00118B0914|nr:multiheme c-type cytochrome [Crateriforma conspicua]QDV64037.1 hypothetical protein Mal65_31850 [Crateriforma conspicua]
MSETNAPTPPTDISEKEQPVARKPVAKRVITPRLRVMLVIVLALFGILAANGLYLTSVTWIQHFTGRVLEDHFYQLMFLGHIGLGLLLIVPTLVFGFAHMWRARNRRNRRAVRIGYGLLVVAIVILISGVLLTRLGGFRIVDPSARRLVYWMHLVAPLVAIWLYWLHRLVGPRIKWHVGRRVALVIAGFVAVMVGFQASDATISDDSGPEEGRAYFLPSLAKTATGNFIASQTLMNDDYCLRCHEDIYDSWLHSAHKLSSFNNPAYRASVRETRQVASDHSGTVKAARFCAGCHDPVPFFAGEFDNPDYDDVANPTAHAGITCVSCHAIQSIDSDRGNADYTIDEPKHYPFTYSDNEWLQSLNELMVQAKPAFHKREMLKPFHKTDQFCGTCHKVFLPGELTQYKEFLRGQNHYDSYLLSGVSGHGARSFYYPEVAQTNCNGCHMPPMASDGFGARYSDELESLAVHNHHFPSANSALSHWFGDTDGIAAHEKILKGSLRVDLFGIRRGESIDAELVAPLGPELPELEPGQTYLIETVLRTLTLGHHFTQGTTDSNQVWVEVLVHDGDKLIGASGQRDEREVVDPWSHFVNNFILDRHGNRINRRNAQDIFTPLYNHQIPPGAGQTIHYRLDVPEDVGDTLRISARLLYRKFDTEYLDYIRADRDPDRDPLDLGRVGDPNDLPIIEIARDEITLAIAGGDGTAVASKQFIPTWQRFNDYGIGLLLKGKAELKQAAEAFAAVQRMGRYDGPLNLARVQFTEGDLTGATESLAVAATMEPPPPAWTHAWLSGMVNRQQGNLEQAAESLESVLNTRVPSRGFDFSKDYVVRNELGLALIDLAQRSEIMGDEDQAQKWYAQAEDHFHQVIDIDAENVTAHANLAEIYAATGQTESADRHRILHERYKPDDNAAEVAIPVARRQYPAANRAAEKVVIYDLGRDFVSPGEAETLTATGATSR